MSRQVSAASAGFTLIEVLVALTIFAVAFAVLLRVFSTSLSHAGEAQNEAAASSLAQTLLADSAAEGEVTDGDRSGDFAGGFRWQLHVEPYGTEADRRAWAMLAKRVTAVVTWSDGGRERSLSLSTLRLLPRGPNP